MIRNIESENSVQDGTITQLLEMQKLLYEGIKILPKDISCGITKKYIHLPVLDTLRKLELVTNTIDVISLLEVNKCDLETLEIDTDNSPSKTKCSQTSAVASAEVCPEIPDDKIIVQQAEKDNDNSFTTRTAPECLEYLKKFQKNYKAEDIIFIGSNG